MGAVRRPRRGPGRAVSGATETPVLLARDLVVSYGPVRAVDTLSLAVSAGRVVAVTGESGAGKSSLLWALAGALPPTSGSVQLPSGSGDRPAVALLPQSFALAAVLTATDNVVVPLLASGVGPGEAAQRAADALACLGLEAVSYTQLDVYKRQAHDLVGADYWSAAVPGLPPRPADLRVGPPARARTARPGPCHAARRGCPVRHDARRAPDRAGAG